LRPAPQGACGVRHEAPLMCPNAACDLCAIVRHDDETKSFGVFKRKRTLAAFVTFSTTWGRHECLRQYPRGFVATWLLPAPHRIRGHRLRVAMAPPPSTLIWENFGVSWYMIRLREVRQ
jgi:hypothetical protein